MLDAGIVLESYETSYNYYKKFIGENCNAVCRDVFEIHEQLFIISYKEYPATTIQSFNIIIWRLIIQSVLKLIIQKIVIQKYCNNFHVINNQN